MSILFDLQLFFRNSKTKLGLSLTHRGLLSALAFRIGSNATTWLKQSTLAKEVGVDESNIRDHMVKIQLSGLIIIDKQKSDKRKLQYKINPIIRDYSIKNDQEKISIHEALGDEYHHLSVNSTKKYQAKSPDIEENTRRNHLVSTRRNHLVNSYTMAPETQLDIDSEDPSLFPKEKEETNIKNKDKRERRALKKPSSINKSSQIKDEFEPNESCIKLAMQNDISISSVLPEFIDYYKGKGISHKDWQATFRNWIRREVKFRENNKHRKSTKSPLKQPGDVNEAMDIANRIRQELIQH